MICKTCGQKVGYCGFDYICRCGNVSMVKFADVIEKEFGYQIDLVAMINMIKAHHQGKVL